MLSFSISVLYSGRALLLMVLVTTPETYVHQRQYNHRDNSALLIPLSYVVPSAYTLLPRPSKQGVEYGNSWCDGCCLLM